MTRLRRKNATTMLDIYRNATEARTTNTTTTTPIEKESFKNQQIRKKEKLFRFKKIVMLKTRKKCPMDMEEIKKKMMQDGAAGADEEQQQQQRRQRRTITTLQLEDHLLAAAAATTTTTAVTAELRNENSIKICLLCRQTLEKQNDCCLSCCCPCRRSHAVNTKKQIEQCQHRHQQQQQQQQQPQAHRVMKENKMNDDPTDFVRNKNLYVNSENDYHSHKNNNGSYEASSTPTKTTTALNFNIMSNEYRTKAAAAATTTTTTFRNYQCNCETRISPANVSFTANTTATNTTKTSSQQNTTTTTTLQHQPQLSTTFKDTYMSVASNTTNTKMNSNSHSNNFASGTNDKNQNATIIANDLQQRQQEQYVASTVPINTNTNKTAATIAIYAAAGLNSATTTLSSLNILATLKFLFLFIQMQLLQCKKGNIFKRHHQPTTTSYFPARQHHQLKQQQQQQTSAASITTTRLKLHRNYYCKINDNNNYRLNYIYRLQQKQHQQQTNDCATTITTNATIITSRNKFNTIEKLEEMQQRQQHINYQQQKQEQHHGYLIKQQQQQHCRQLQYQQTKRHLFYRLPNFFNKTTTSRSSLFIVFLILSFLICLPSSIYAQTTMSPITSLTSQQQQLQRLQQLQKPYNTFESSLAKVRARRSNLTTSQVRLSRNETVCKSMDIRNNASEFNQLYNCTVIEGFLLITLLNTHTLTETYPQLTEVTEFIVVYRVDNLRSLSQIFPNLSIIRGKSLFDGYALVIYQNRHLEDLGLTKLMAIANGGVRIEKNLSLCFLTTIDWTQIVANTTENVLRDNRNPFECPKCPGDNKGESQDANNIDVVDTPCKEYAGRRRYCWNSTTCQKICPESCRNNCIDENTCCKDACLGGCSMDNSVQKCTSCRHYSIHNNICIDKCPDDYYSYLDRRCITAATCAGIGTKIENTKQLPLVAYNGLCTTRCPEGYNQVNSTCQKCGDQCTKKCEGGVIDSFVRAREFHGCTEIITRGLTISIKRGGTYSIGDLEFGLSAIRVIRTHLKVHLTFGIFSLSFFKNLEEIEGKVLYEDRYALYVLENNDLETIWAPNRTVKISNGSVFFHFNSKLCYSEIDALRPAMVSQNGTFNKNEVATDSNGNKGSCNTEILYTVVNLTTDSMALVMILNPLTFADERTFIGYQFFYIEDPNRNATKHGFRPCDDGWSSLEPTKDHRNFFQKLEPFKQYAYYVKTMTISSEPRNAQSEIEYFRTKPAQPQFVRKLEADAISPSEIKLTWKPPLNAYGNLTKYVVRAVLNQRISKLETRNYCKDPLKETFNNNRPSYSTAVTEKPLTALDCKCNNEQDEESGHFDPENNERTRQDNIDFENTLQNFVYVKQTNATRQKAKPAKPMISDNMIDDIAQLNDSDQNGDNNYAFGVGLENRIIQKRDLLQRQKIIAEELIDPTESSFMVRHMTRRSSSIDYDDDNAHLSSTTKWPPNDYPETWLNETKMDSESKYYEIYVQDVDVNKTEFVFTNLKHYSMYTLAVVACREREINDTQKTCSIVVLIDKITLKLENVDIAENFRPELEPTNTTRSNIRLHWDPPINPNGAVVSYTISFELQAQDAVEEFKCITESDYQNFTNGYLLTNLHEGNYSIRIRANSLAGEGIYTEKRYILVPPSQISAGIIAAICIAVLVVILIPIGIVGYFMRKKAAPSDLTIFPTVNPFYMSLQYEPDEWEVPRERIIQLSPLGQGSFGMVYEGILKGYHNTTEDTPCAIKTVNENATDRERMNFLNEASVMKQFDTYHVVRLLGVCSHGQPALVVMELMKNGDLKSYLRAHRPDEREDIVGGGGGVVGAGGLQPPPISRFYQMAIEIADGMAYLAAKKFVHRDLAARNCMVAADLTVKIGDFGMTRDIYETDYYRKGTKGLLPVRWMPPESLRDGVYSSASDVFSYGVVLWEMATLASQPYPGYSNDQVLRYVIDGGVMERPENCPDNFYALMQSCWHHRQAARPTFMEIIRLLLDMADQHFHEVSFFHSEEGQQVFNKEKAEKMEQFGEGYQDQDNDIDDATTPLRVGEYHPYNLKMGNNSSIENQGESPMVADEEHPNSPYSLRSAFIVSSTPDRQSKDSYNLSQNNPTLSSAPSTSAGGTVSGNLQQPQSTAMPSRLYYGRAIPASQAFKEDDSAAYVLPDNNARATTYEQSNPNYNDLSTYEGNEPDELPTNVKSSKFSGEEHLLPRQKTQSSLGVRKTPSLLPMSCSMPDDVIGNAPLTMSASLHPSTASAASSNASSNVAPGYSGKIPQSLKKAVADNFMSARLRNFNRHFFNHKRTGSNASHKSTSSNPNTFGGSSSSNTNLTEAVGTSGGGASGGYSKSTSGTNLGTIESGGSGSAGSYCGTPRFFTSTQPATSSGINVSENPNYKILNESATNAAKNFSATNESANPNYKLLNESLNTTQPTEYHPNYEIMQAPIINSSENPNYVMMNEPTVPTSSTHSAKMPISNISENPNYQMMGPSFYSHDRSAERLNNSTSSSSAASSDDEHDNGEADEHTEHIKMERMPLSHKARAQQRGGGSNKRSNRSRSQSQTNQEASSGGGGGGGGGDDRTTSTANTRASLQQPKAASTFSLKEMWLRQQQPPRPPPPNGFIGREA